MSKDIVNAPTARSWRDIPQPVKPRAMSREGKWRLTTSFLRTCGVAAVLGGVAWGTWEVVRALQENPSKTPESAKALPVSNLELTTDGVLRPEWLARTLALPKNASLMELDLQALRTRLFASGQVTAANLSKKLPHTLRAQVAERSPIARVRASLRGEEKTLLVARDGVVFEGEGYAEDTLALLPWLDGVKLARADNRFLPLDGIGVVADLLARARLDAAHLYRTWDVVSLARLASDNEIVVRTKPGPQVVFAANGDFFQQLAKLDYQWDAFVAMPSPPAKIDLSLGREVSVAFQPVARPVVKSAAPEAAARPAAAYNFFPHSQPKSKL